MVKDSEQGSPCTAGGLHMPNSKSMNSFAKRMRRIRHHSQCNPEVDKMQSSTGSSPGKGKISISWRQSNNKFIIRFIFR